MWFQLHAWACTPCHVCKRESHPTVNHATSLVGCRVILIFLFASDSLLCEVISSRHFVWKCLHPSGSRSPNLPPSLRNRLEVSQHSTPGLERESPKNEDVLLHNHKTVLRIQHFHLIFGPLSNFPSDPNNNRRCGFCGSGPNRGSPREYSCLYKLQRASPKDKDICLRNHNTMVTFGKLKTGSVLLSDGLSSPACPPSHL